MERGVAGTAVGQYMENYRVTAANSKPATPTLMRDLPFPRGPLRNTVIVRRR